MGAGNATNRATLVQAGDKPGQNSVNNSNAHDEGVFGRINRIGLKPERLTTVNATILKQIVESCPACESPERCKAELNDAAPPRGWDDWDEYCPNAARLCVFAALTMFTPLSAG